VEAPELPTDKVWMLKGCVGSIPDRIEITNTSEEVLASIEVCPAKGPTVDTSGLATHGDVDGAVVAINGHTDQAVDGGVTAINGHTDQALADAGAASNAHTDQTVGDAVENINGEGDENVNVIIDHIDESADNTADDTFEKVCTYVGAEISVGCYDAETWEDVPCDVVLSGPVNKYEESNPDFSSECTASGKPCAWACLLPVYHSVAVVADGYYGVIWDNAGGDLVAGHTYPLEIALPPEATPHAEDSLVEFPGFEMAVGTALAVADFTFQRYGAGGEAIDIPAAEAAYSVLSGTSVTLATGSLTAVAVGQTTVQRCWTGHTPSVCQTFTVTAY
jgi:hypothetical protein